MMPDSFDDRRVRETSCTVCRLSTPYRIYIEVNSVMQLWQCLTGFEEREIFMYGGTSVSFRKLIGRREIDDRNLETGARRPMAEVACFVWKGDWILGRKCNFG
jgi:hypothetical protein